MALLTNEMPSLSDFFVFYNVYIDVNTSANSKIIASCRFCLIYSSDKYKFWNGGDTERPFVYATYRITQSGKHAML